MANRTEASKLVGETYRLPAADAEKIMEPIQWYIHFDPAFRAALMDAAEFAKQAGIIKDMPSLDPYLRADILEAVDRARIKGK
jgi:hypothetical protein